LESLLVCYLPLATAHRLCRVRASLGPRKGRAH
jgi:hypothetical protein